MNAKEARKLAGAKEPWKLVLDQIASAASSGKFEVRVTPVLTDSEASYLRDKGYIVGMTSRYIKSGWWQPVQTELISVIQW